MRLFLSLLASLATARASTTALPPLGIPEADAAFSRGQYEAAIAHAGNLRRVRRVIARAAAGEPVTLSVLGGSISAGSTLGVHNRRGSWLWHGRLFNWFNSTWPAAPGATHTHFNGAVPASTPAYVDGCLAFHLPTTADLIFIEYTLNTQVQRESNLRDRCLLSPGSGRRSRHAN